MTKIIILNWFGQSELIGPKSSITAINLGSYNRSLPENIVPLILDNAN